MSGGDAHRDGVRLLGGGCGSDSSCSPSDRRGQLARAARRRVALFLSLALVLLGLATGVAQAEPPKLISYGNFNPVTTYPEAIAVDQSSGDVYAAGIFNPSGEAPIDKFDASGKQRISPPSPFGETFGISAAVNPVNGDLYVLTLFGTVDVYNPDTGEVVSAFAVAPSHNLFGFYTVVQIGVDAAGNVYVPVVPENKVLEYGASEPHAVLGEFTGGSGPAALKGPTGVAVDASGNVWVADAGNNRIEQLSPADVAVAEVKSQGVETLALDGHGDVLATVRNEEDFCGSLQPPCYHVLEYDETGKQVADVGAGSFEGGYSAPQIAVDDASGRVYIGDGFKHLVWIFGPPSAPTVGTELVAEVGTSEAKLGALVNAGGIGTTYRFEYGTTTAYGSSIPMPEGSAGEEITAHTVWAAASGLQPGTTYHYRVVVTNELGTVVGPDQTFTTLTAAQTTCANEEFRGGFSARLPDCRAYELVTAPTKNSIEAENAGAIAADGNAAAFKANDPMPGAPSGADYYLATRSPAGWSSEDVIPLESYSETTCAYEGQPGPLAYSANLSMAVLEYGHDTRASTTPQSLEDESCNAEGLQVVSGEPVGYQNLLLRDNATGTYRLINAPPPGVTPADANLKAASADLSHVVFTETAPLAEGAQYGAENLYEWDEGALRVLSVLPDGTPVLGSLAGEPSGDKVDASNLLSAEGSHILFTYGGALYDRIDGRRTVQVDEAQGGPGSSGGGTFQVASANGQEVFFTDESRLTPDATAQAGEPDLYECQLPEGAPKCVLSDLTVAAGGEHADVMRVTPLGTHDSTHLYFIAKGILASNTRQFTNSEGKSIIERAEAGAENLYLWNGNETTFIAAFTPNSYYTYGGGQTSPDGTWFALLSRKSLTGYDNLSASGIPAPEVFLYSAASGQIECASCNPSGEAPASLNYEEPRFAARNLSDGGRLFFETGEALVPSDSNGQEDVYEYENGHLYLISSGTSTRPSTFVSASESGSDVFFLSYQALVPQDTLEGMQAIYDARAGGGFPTIAAPSACTTADACRAPVSSQPSIYGAPSSQTFSGAGNLAPPSEGKRSKKRHKKRKACRQQGGSRARRSCKARKHTHHKRKVKTHKGGK